MAELINTANRQLIPRWHTSRKLELFQHLNIDLITPDQNSGKLFNIDDKKNYWLSNPTVGTATDLFISMYLANMWNSRLYNELKKFLLSRIDDVSQSIINIINPSLRKIDSSIIYATNKSDIYKIINTLKAMVRVYPRDSLSWNDLAFYYAILGEKIKAEHCMVISCGINPNHPYLVRSLARLLVHHNEPEKAVFVLRKANKVTIHPEILSADIAIRSFFDIGRPDVNAARRLIKQNFLNPFMISELSASIGTLEIQNGAIKKGKKHLAESAISPTENTVAQLRWLSQQHKIYTPMETNATQSLEARAIDYYNDKDYIRCRDKLVELHEFQPFSSQALVDAGYISLMALEDSKFVCDLYQKFSSVKSANVTVSNNYILAKLLIGDIKGAEIMLSELIDIEMKDSDKAVLSATIGYYFYQIGQEEEARRCYENTFMYFKSVKNSFNLSVALLYQGIAEKKISTGKGNSILEKAKLEAKKISWKPAELIERIDKEINKN